MAKEETEMCECGWCGNSGHTMRGHFTHRLIVIIIATVVTFWVGFKLGEIQGFLESVTRTSFHHQGFGMWNNDGPDYPMMRAIPATTSAGSAATTPAAPTPTTATPPPAKQ